MAPTLTITDRDGFRIGSIEARVGLRTWAGPITRVSAKSIWVRTAYGTDRLIRAMDGLPSVTRSNAKVA